MCSSVPLLTFVNKRKTCELIFSPLRVQQSTGHLRWKGHHQWCFHKCFRGLDQSRLCSSTFSVKGSRGVETVLLWNRSTLRAGKSHFTACGCPVWSLCQHVPSRVCKGPRAKAEGERCAALNGALQEMSAPEGDEEMNNQWHSSVAACYSKALTRLYKSIQNVLPLC